MDTIIVAAGRALRLHPEFNSIPKCLLKIDEKTTILDHQIQNLKKCGIDKIVVK